MALNAIAEEMMRDDSNTCITYSNDGSSMSGVGAYVVQSLTISGVQRSLLTRQVKRNIGRSGNYHIKNLSAASCHKYSAQDILCKISFVMTDSTSHV